MTTKWSVVSITEKDCEQEKLATGRFRGNDSFSRLPFFAAKTKNETEPTRQKQAPNSTPLSLYLRLLLAFEVDVSVCGLRFLRKIGRAPCAFLSFCFW